MWIQTEELKTAMSLLLQLQYVLKTLPVLVVSSPWVVTIHVYSLTPRTQYKPGSQQCIASGQSYGRYQANIFCRQGQGRDIPPYPELCWGQVYRWESDGGAVWCHEVQPAMGSGPCPGLPWPHTLPVTLHSKVSKDRIFRVNYSILATKVPCYWVWSCW